MPPFDSFPTNQSESSHTQQNGLAMDPKIWRASPFLKGSDSPLIPKSDPANQNPNRNGPETPGAIWKPDVTSKPNSSSTASREHRVAADNRTADDLLKPQLGFYGIEGQVYYLISGGTGGTIGKHLAAPAANRLSSLVSQSNLSESGWLKRSNVWLSSTLRNESAEATGAAINRGGIKNNSFVQGMAIAGTTMLVDNYMDRVLFGKDHQQGVGSALGLSSIALPLALASERSWKAQALIGIGGAAAGKIIESFVPASKERDVSRIFAPTGTEALTMGVAFLAPVSSKARVGIVAGAWLLNRGYNLVKGLFETDGVAVKNDAFSALKHDSEKHSDSSMNDAIDSFKKLGNVNRNVLEVEFVNYVKRPDSSFTNTDNAHRGAVVLGTAYGERQLEEPMGELDVGAKALRALLIAKNNLTRVNDKSDLPNTEKRIDAAISRVYEKHDMAAAVEEFSQSYIKDSSAFIHRKMNVDAQIAVNQNFPDKRFVAKLFRDSALFSLAFAKSRADGAPQDAAIALRGTDQGRQQLNGYGRPRQYDGAFDAIRIAKSLDPSNPDTAELEKVAQQLSIRLPK